LIWLKTQFYEFSWGGGIVFPPAFLFNYSSEVLAVFTYRINRNDVGIIIKRAVAITPRMLTSILKK
jgi:hypothetical protein